MPQLTEYSQKQPAAVKNSRERIAALDLLRGAAMIYVMLYHLMYDLRYIYHADTPPLITPGNTAFEYAHIFFLWILFSVSGICTGFSRDPLKRGVLLYIAGWLITAATSVFMPSQLIVFGVISCFGACMCITSLFRPLLDKLPWQMIFFISVLMWLILHDFYKSGQADLIFIRIALPQIPNAGYLYPIGIKGEGFKSADYFPIIPYIFMFTAGVALYRPISQKKLPQRFYSLPSGAVGFIGRHSLLFYALHQPLFLLLTELAVKLK